MQHQPCHGKAFNWPHDRVTPVSQVYKAPNLTAWINIGQWSLPAPDQGGTGIGFGSPNNVATDLHPGVDYGTNTGNCLESGTGFYRNLGQTQTASVFWIGDFCNLTPDQPLEAFPVQLQMDGNFQQAYIRNFGDGLPRISVEVYQPLGDTRWHVIVYNYAAQHWDDFYAAPGNLVNSPVFQITGPYGWSLDETHFVNYGDAACPSLPTASANNIKVNVEPGGPDTNNYFRQLQFSDYRVDFANPAQCFVNDGTLTPYYTWYDYTDQYNGRAWQAFDPSGPTPSPKPTKPPPCGGSVPAPAPTMNPAGYPPGCPPLH